jgi:hypothetical protein
MNLSLNVFLADRYANLYKDVIIDPAVNFEAWIAFFNRSDIQQRMIDSEIDHRRPALAGVIRELENTPVFRNYLEGYDGHKTKRGRQAIGVIARLVMEGNGFRKTGRKGTLGRRARVTPNSTDPGAYHNISGLSIWFTKAEHYEPEQGFPY